MVPKDNATFGPPADTSEPAPEATTSTAEENPAHEKYDEECAFLEQGAADGIGYWGAVAHMIRATVGTGILLLPYQMKTLGYVTGSLLLLAVCAVYYHIIHILLYLDSRLRRHLKRQRLTYAVIADEIFARAPSPLRKLRKCLLCVIYLYYIVPTGKSISLVIISNNVVQMAAFFGAELHFGAVIAVVLVALATLCMCRSILTILVPFSSVANVFTFIIATTIVVYSMVDAQPAAVVRPFGDTAFLLNGMVIFFNSVLATDIVLPLKNGMREPHRLAGLAGGVNVTACVIVVVYYTFALVPYLSYGDAVKVNVFDNVPVNGALTLAMNAVYTLALSVSYVLSFYACFDVVWSSKLQAQLATSPYRVVCEYAIRLGFNGLAYLLAVGASNLAIISALGGIIGILLDVVFMPLLQIMLMCILDERNYAVICKNVALTCVALALFCMSIVDCVNEVRKLYGCGQHC